MMRVLALDVGDKRIGVAISDPSQVLARSLKVIQRSSRQEDLAAVARLVEEYEVERVVVGYPRSLNGTVGEQAEKVERYAADLAEVLDVPVLLWDERFSTVSAERLMRKAGLRGKKKRERVDAVAAAVILQDYLDSR
jgi:putative Holliday junction resolvase